MGQTDGPEEDDSERIQQYQSGEDPKMKIRKEAVILGIVIVVLSLYLVFNKRDRTLYELPKLDPIPVSEISKITLDSSENSIAFIRKAGEWVINKEAYAGDENTINRLADIIANLRLTTLISESKNYERYDLDPEHKITVKAWNNDKLVREFDVGKAASGQRHTFVKLAENYRVYQAAESFRSRLKIQVDDFRRKTVMAFEPELIDQIQVTTVNGEEVFTRDKSSAKMPETSDAIPADGDVPGKESVKPVWKNSTGSVVEEAKLAKLLEDFSSFKCNAFIYDRKKEDLKDPIATLVFKGAEDYTLQIFERLEKGAAQYPATSSQNEYPFFIQKWQTDRVNRVLTEIVPKS